MVMMINGGAYCLPATYRSLIRPVRVNNVPHRTTKQLEMAAVSGLKRKKSTTDPSSGRQGGIQVKKRKRRLHLYNSDDDDEEQPGGQVDAVPGPGSDPDGLHPLKNTTISLEAQQGGPDHVTGSISTISSVEDDEENEDDKEEEEEISDEDHSSKGHKRRKRDDPDVFARSLSKILNSKLSSSKRADPVLARSKVALAANQELVDVRLEAKARHQMRDEKRAQLDRGRVRDVLGVNEGDSKMEGSAAEVMELERRLKKTAQRGVVKLFNAVRAAQVKGEQAAREANRAGLFSATEKKDRVNEMSKQGFLDLIAGGATDTNRRSGMSN